MCSSFVLDPNFPQKLDAADPLAPIRARFFRQADGVREIYLEGNSLGLCSQDAVCAVSQVIDDWKKHGISIWSIEDEKYLRLPSRLGDIQATLIGAEPGEVVIANSATVNIHQCLATFYNPTPERYKILVDDQNFPSDRYAVNSQARLHGYDPDDAVKVVASSDGRLISEDDIIQAMTDDVALVFLPSVTYRYAQLLDMERISAAAVERGIPVGWDLCHSIGLVPHAIGRLNADFAVWCNYKYMSAGPGASGGMYVNKKHFGREPGLGGWQGSTRAQLFVHGGRLDAAESAAGWLMGTPALLSMAPLEGVLKIYQEAGLERVRAKSLQMTGYLMYLLDNRLPGCGLAIVNPREGERRGGHIALVGTEAERVYRELDRRGIVVDYRAPDSIRVTPHPLYNTFEEIYAFVDELTRITKGA